jgi:hypothetical protein
MPDFHLTGPASAQCIQVSGNTLSVCLLQQLLSRVEEWLVGRTEGIYNWQGTDMLYDTLMIL